MSFIILLISLALFVQSLFSLYLMLYSWEHPERLEASRGPRSFLPSQLSFTILLPARHEEAVIYETIKRVWAANYPSDLLEIVVICHADDTGTIAEAQRAIREIGSQRIRVETFSTPPINKPRGLNVGFQRTRNQVVTIFDAEDDIDPDIFNVVNTIMLEERVGIVQAGVQLMNFRDHWFAIHNCMEYFFWFKSRLHFHAKVGMIPLGGNTVFIRRDLLERVSGWDEQCLTEDADIGLRLSALGEPIRVVYEAQHVTREETPESVGSFIRQRTRWQQGFLQVLRKGTWLALPRLKQRLLAIYTLSFPFLQALLILLWPLTIFTILWLKVPVLVAMVSFLPLYALLFQFIATAVGAFMFTREYGLKFPGFKLMSMALTFLPFQWLLSISAIRGVYRELRRQRNWEKTAHVGAHRQPEIVSAPGFERLLDEDITEKRQIIRPTLPVQPAVLVVPEHEQKSYPTDLTDAQWQRIAPLLPPTTPNGHQHKVEPREVVNGILYVVCGSHDWRSFPCDLPPRGTVYSYFRRWQLDGTLKQIIDALCSEEFEGSMQSDGNLAGSFCILNQKGQCAGEDGVWSAVHASFGG